MILPRAGDRLSRAEIRSQLIELNEAYDGPTEVAVLCRVTSSGWNGAATGYGDPFLGYPDWAPQNAVVVLPGDGKPFPVAAYVEALRVSEVQLEP